MKTIIALLIFAFSMNAAAHQDIASYEFGLRADMNNFVNVTVNVRKVVVDSEGLLKVYETPMVFGGIEPGSSLIATKQLTEETFQNISSMVSSISDSEIIERFNEVVCMIAVSPEQYYDHLSVARDYNWQTGHYINPLTVVLGPQGCWVGHAIYLADSRDNDTAVRLKAMLRILGMELI